ncbi:discoidin domain-containing protein [Winogradskya consettensis]|uniref:discoidin domain-containing protein n=1 Tax=Winogradskya consettensis TaxID=113560 RepID=UPI001BB3C513|nr:discoidin domain-containing protein [Actinoplanes consettensis]
MTSGAFGKRQAAAAAPPLVRPEPPSPERPTAPETPPAASRGRRRWVWASAGAAALAVVTVGVAVALRPSGEDDAAAGGPPARAFSEEAPGATTATGTAPSAVASLGALSDGEVSNGVVPLATGVPSTAPSAGLTTTAPAPKVTVTTPAGRVNDGADLALHRPVSVSSTEGRAWPGADAVDGDDSTRWGSGFADNQWIAVDLGELWSVSRVEVVWERAYATEYRVEVSDNGSAWRSAYTGAKGKEGAVTTTFKATPARWVRVYGLQRSNGYGISVYRLSVR